MGHPPNGQEENHQMAMQVAQLVDRTTFDVPATAFGILERSFHPHAPAINDDELATRWPIGNHDPNLVIARFPAESQRGGKAMLLPDQSRTIPLLPFFFDQLSAAEPGCIASLVLAPH